jgi:hypothetical protein
MRFGMTTLALALAFTAVIAAGLAAPGQLVAIGCGIAAIGVGKVAYGRRTASGAARLGGAAAMTVGAIGLTLGIVRVAVILAAISRVEHML